jgi:RIO kinase 2
MESTKGSKSEDEREEEEEGEEEEEEEEEEGEGDEGEKMGVSERVEVEGGVENMGAGSNVEEPEHEDEEPDRSAKLWQVVSESEEAKKSEASRASESRERAGSESVSPCSSSPVGQLASKVESSCTVSVKAASSKGQEIKDKAAIEAYKQRAREKQKHHSRRGAERIGRAKGSKAKQDNRVKLDKGGLWD